MEVLLPTMVIMVNSTKRPSFHMKETLVQDAQKIQPKHPLATAEVLLPEQAGMVP